MIYVLLGLLAVFLWISFIFGGKDFFSPSTVQILTFFGSVMMCIYFMWSMDCHHSFTMKTISMIAGAMTMSVIIGIVVHRLFFKVDIKPHTLESVEISPISNIASIFILGIIIFTIFWQLMEIRRIGGVSGGFYETMNRFHARNFYVENETSMLPWFLNQLLDMVRCLFLVYGFNFIRFFDSLKPKQRFLNLMIIVLCCLGLLLTGRRLPIVNLFIGCLIVFHFLGIQKREAYKQYSFKTFIKMGLLVLLIAAVFFLTKSLVGRASRNEAMNAADYISYYTGSGLIAFDEYVQRPPYADGFWGKETFTSLNMFLVNYKIIPRYRVQLEFRPVGAGFTNNVYTFLRCYHYDFGVLGMYLLHGISILLLSVFYEYVKKKRGNLGILIFAQLYYTIVMSFFTERFYADIFSMNYIQQLITLLILYELLIRKRIRLKFRRTAHGLHPIPIRQESHSIDS